MVRSNNIETNKYKLSTEYEVYFNYFPLYKQHMTFGKDACRMERVALVVFMTVVHYCSVKRRVKFVFVTVECLEKWILSTTCMVIS